MSAHSWWENRRSAPALTEQSRRGITIVELLISCGLFMLVTLSFFQIMAPALNRTWKVERKQDNMQNFVLFKELMTRRLDNSLLVQSHFYSQSFEFYSPYQVDTLGGRVNMIDTAEMIYWNERVFNKIYVKTVGSEKVVTELKDGAEKKIWNLGTRGTAEFSLVTGTNPLLVTRVTIYDIDNPDALPFHKSFSTYVRNFK